MSAPSATKSPSPGASLRRAPVLRVEGASPRAAEPISIGVPFPRGAYREVDLRFADRRGRGMPTQWETLARWPDGSVRWALLDALASLEDAAEESSVSLVPASEAGAPAAAPGPLQVLEGPSSIEVRTGRAAFSLSRAAPRIAAEPASAPPGSSVEIAAELIGARSQPAAIRLARLRVEASGPVRATVLGSGIVESEGDQGSSRPRRERGRPNGDGRRPIEVDLRASFFAGTGLLRLDLTLRNPRAAAHPGGLWDLGDPASFLFRGLAVRARVSPQPAAPSAAWLVEPGGPVVESHDPRVLIYQASSGGENWSHGNHGNADGVVPLPFRGFVVRAGGVEEPGLRASPVLAWACPGLRVATAAPRFWAEFPKSLEAGPGGISVGLFPLEHPDLFELQPGEQKTHTVFFRLDPPAGPGGPRALEWVHAPLRVRLDPEWYAASGAIPRFAAAAEDPHEDYKAFVRRCIDGPSSFFAKREVIDEYGWRHFGEVYADHENELYGGPKPVVSHYNNQYDLLLGLLLQGARTGEPAWLELAGDLARHVADIDIYHTRDDKPAYNGGLFWHTDHYADAATATHRTYSRAHPRAKAGLPYGGGPSCEHNYTTGLLLYHLMTGSPQAREAVLGLARWVLDMDDGGKTPLGRLEPGPTGLASATRSPDYHGPGRGAGNSVNALLDAFSLTGERLYLEKAEELIRRCIHPRDDIEARGLRDPEGRWSYLVFLQALAKHLDAKVELGELDRAFEHARASLLAYAEWMLSNEVPYMQVLDKVEHPTATWPAHDVRKSAVFDYAAAYGPARLRVAFREKAELYFRECLRGVASFPTGGCTRPLAVLLQSGTLRAAFLVDASAPCFGEPEAGSGSPEPFEPQAVRAARLLRSPRGLLRLSTCLLRPRELAGMARAAAGLLRRRLRG
ncbi:MAG: hypothetical protein HY721_24135 [Planctomycetes bacterium]|nr:hypothetical protein [Planctomycetota bacterium]